MAKQNQASSFFRRPRLVGVLVATCMIAQHACGAPISQTSPDPDPASQPVAAPPNQGIKTLKATKFHEEFDGTGHLVTSTVVTTRLFIRLPDTYVVTIRDAEGELISKTFGRGISNVTTAPGKEPEFFESSVPLIKSVTYDFFELPSIPARFALLSSQINGKQKTSVYALGNLLQLTLVQSIPENFLLSSSTQFRILPGTIAPSLLTTYTGYQTLLPGVAFASSIVTAPFEGTIWVLDSFSRIIVNAPEEEGRDDEDDKDLDRVMHKGTGPS